MDAPGRALSTEIVRGGGGENGADTAKGADAMTIERERERLFGDAAIARARGWAEDGCVEPDVVDALESLRARSDDWAGADLGDTLFALLGGTSELCPLVPLLRLGAHVAVVAREGAKLEEAVSEAARSETGTLYVPLTETNSSNSESRRGADLAARAPEIRAWLESVFAAGTFSRVVVGAYAYADGEAHVRATLASDLVLAGLHKTLGPSRVAAAFLSSPGTAFPIPRAAWRHAKGRERDAEANEGARSTGGSWWASSAAAGSRQTAARLWRERASILQIEVCPRRLSSRTCTTDTSFCRVRLRARQDAAELARGRVRRERRGDEREHGPRLAHEIHAPREGGRDRAGRAEALPAAPAVRRRRDAGDDGVARAPRLGRGPRREARARGAGQKKSDEKTHTRWTFSGGTPCTGARGGVRGRWTQSAERPWSRGRCGVERVSASARVKKKAKSFFFLQVH